MEPFLSDWFPSPLQPPSQVPMTSPHHHHHHHHQSQSNQCSYCCTSCCCFSSSNSSPPPSTNSDQLLRALTNHLLLQSPSPPPHLYAQQHYHLKSQQHHRPPTQEHQQHKDHQQTQSLLHSLLRRVSALESSLPHLAPPPPQTSPSPPLSLRDLAARTIQSRFRLFLVRRSQTLRHLKHLASIKSHVADLRSSLSSKTHLAPPETLSQKAMDLLLQLDSIQSGDPMIREGKRSISRELVRILEFVDKVLVKAAEEDDEVPCSKPVKRVSFAGNVVESRVFANLSETIPTGGFPRVSGGEEEETHLRSQGFYQFSDGEESPKAIGEDRGRYGRDRVFQGQNGNLGLSAPLPVHMEPRRSGSRNKNSP